MTRRAKDDEEEERTLLLFSHNISEYANTLSKLAM
jgi:hypothetical protein